MKGTATTVNEAVECGAEDSFQEHVLVRSQWCPSLINNWIDRFYQEERIRFSNILEISLHLVVYFQEVHCPCREAQQMYIATRKDFILYNLVLLKLSACSSDVLITDYADIPFLELDRRP